MRFAGLSWERSVPLILARDGDGTLSSRPVGVGERLGWRIGARRRCVGIGAEPCPASAPVTGRGQCTSCAWNDPGQLVAKDQVVPPGVFRTYLALFGAGAVKVGLCSARRGDDRLLEQGAAAHVFVAEGPYPAMRAAERSLGTALGLPEHVTWRRKRELWSRTRGPDERAVPLERAAARARALLDRELVVDAPVTDDVPRYGLDPATLPRELRVVAELHAGDVVAGAVIGIIGKMLVLDRALVVDTRGVEGWPVSDTARPLHLAAAPVREHHVQQPVLFGGAQDA